MQKWVEGASHPADLERVAKLTCLRPIPDGAMREAVLGLARRAVEIGKDQLGLPYFRMTLGMAEYRSGQFEEAVQTLLANASLDDHIGGTSAFYRAMSLFQQGKKTEASALFTEAEAKMKPLPAGEKNPLVGEGTTRDEIILWLAFKEARGLLAEPGNGKQP